MSSCETQLPGSLDDGLARRWNLRQQPTPALAGLTETELAGFTETASVDLHWMPLGVGDLLPFVRWSGRAFETLVARQQHREVLDLYHCALVVHLSCARYVIEMTPAWQDTRADRGVVSQGAIGLPRLGRSRFFRYEVRRWRGGVVSAAQAVTNRRRVGVDRANAQLLLDLVPTFPNATWGRDELAAGDMWNSNSLVSWLLAASGHDVDNISTPAHGRAPGWHAGIAVASRITHSPSR